MGTVRGGPTRGRGQSLTLLNVSQRQVSRIFLVNSAKSDYTLNNMARSPLFANTVSPRKQNYCSLLFRGLGGLESGKKSRDNAPLRLMIF